MIYELADEPDAAYDCILYAPEHSRDVILFCGKGLKAIYTRLFRV